jgi:8-oxo-dGTP pyrophosphatase MutT (NUDIX family)
MEGDAPFFLLPGGGQKHAETLPDALRREVMEEVGVPIEVGDLVLVRDYIARNHEFADQSDGHQLELYFRCELGVGEIPDNGPHPDKWQVGVEWLDLSNLRSAPLYPKVLASMLYDLDRPHAVIFRDMCPTM